MLERPRPASADILYLIKERALSNLYSTTVGEAMFVLGVFAIGLCGLLLINELLLRRSLSVRHLTLPSFFVAMYIVLMAVPSVVWFYAAPNDPIRYTYFAAMQVPLIALPVGVMFANALYGQLSNPPQVARFFSGALKKAYDDRAGLRYWLIMLMLSMIVTVYYIATSSYVPLIGAFTSYGELAPAAVRRAIVAEGVVVHYGHALTARLFLPFCLLYAHFMAYLYGGRWRMMFWPTLGVVAFVSSLTFDRMFPFSVMLYLVLAIYFRYDDQTTAGTSSRRTMMLRLGVYATVLLTLGMLVGGIVSLTQFNKPMSLEIIYVTARDFLFNRVLLDPSYMAYIYFEQFNEPSTFLHGKAMHVLVSKALGGEFYPLISPSFVATLWVNFGWPGVVLGSAMVGFVLQLVQVWAFDRKTIPALTCYIIMLLNGAWIIYGHLLATMVFSVYVPGILILMRLRSRRKAAARAAERRLVPQLHNIASS